MAGVLCDLVCGRRFLPAVRKCSASRAILYSSASRSTKRTGVSMASRVMPMYSVVIIGALLYGLGGYCLRIKKTGFRFLSSA